MDMFKGQPFAAARAETAAIDAGLRSYFLNIYNYMASGLLLTGIVAYLGAQSQTVTALFYKVNEAGQLAGMTGLGWLVAFAPLAFVLFLGMKIQTMSVQAAKTAFFGFAVVMGLSMMNLFFIYTGASIARVFLITSITFEGMSLYGYTTKKDLSGMGSFLIMGAWGLFVGFIINMFLKSSALDFALSAIGVLVFTGLIAYDTQRLKSLYYSFSGSAEMVAKSAIYGALQLYLDFINLFIMLLRFLGDRR